MNALLDSPTRTDNPIMDYPLDFAMALQNLLDRGNLLQKDLAALTGSSPTTINRMMKGKTKPHQSKIRLILDKLCRDDSEIRELSQLYDRVYNSDLTKRLGLTPYESKHSETLVFEEPIQPYNPTATLETDLIEALETSGAPFVKIRGNQFGKADIHINRGAGWSLLLNGEPSNAEKWQKVFANAVAAKNIHTSAGRVIVVIPYWTQAAYAFRDSLNPMGIEVMPFEQVVEEAKKR